MEYDCVIIPDFGGFVLNKESASINEVILPPSITVGFNPALKHNDGLLAESYMKSKSISYDAACKLINEAVKKINGFLSSKQTVIFPKLGSFILNEEANLIFTPTKETLKHPSIIGFSPVELKRLEDISRANETKIQEYKRFGIKRSLAGVAAAAAAVIMFFSLSTPIKDTDRSQKSSFFTTTTTSSIAPKTTLQPTPSATIKEEEGLRNHETQVASAVKQLHQVVEEETPIQIQQQKETANTDRNAEIKNSSVGYYIVVGSCPNDAIAKKMVHDLKNDGFSDAIAIPSKTRIRVAVAQFENKSVAERYLNNFKSEYSEYDDAWLLTSK